MCLYIKCIDNCLILVLCLNITSNIWSLKNITVLNQTFTVNLPVYVLCFSIGLLRLLLFFKLFQINATDKVFLYILMSHYHIIRKNQHTFFFLSVQKPCWGEEWPSLNDKKKTQVKLISSYCLLWVAN